MPEFVSLLKKRLKEACAALVAPDYPALSGEFVIVEMPRTNKRLLPTPCARSSVVLGRPDVGCRSPHPSTMSKNTYYRPSKAPHP